MHLIEDNRKRKKDDDDDEDSDKELKEKEEDQEAAVSFPFETGTENISLTDSEAIKLEGVNPLAEEELVEEDDNGDG